MFINMKDSYRASVEAATGGRNTVLYDNAGNPSVMVVVPKFRLEEIDSSLGNGVHPAFIVNNKELPEIYIAKYPASVYNGRALSMPMVEPTVNINFDTARARCTAKGRGWHLMTNAERAAIGLWCLKNGYQPRGNTSSGKSHSATYEHGVMCSDNNKTKTGSGPVAWNHDNTIAGIADLCGNVSEWNDGLKLVNGKIYVHGANGQAMNNFNTQNEKDNVTGWLDTGCYMDSVAAGSDGGSGDLGAFNLSGTLTHKAHTGSTEGDFKYNSLPFKSLAAASGYTIPTILKQLAIAPIPAFASAYKEDRIYCRNYGERVPVVGGYCGIGARAGLFYLNLYYARTLASGTVGFRPAFAAI